MTNEDKILELLMSMQKNIVELKTDVTGIKSEITDIKSDMTSMKSEITDIKSDMTSMKSEITDMRSDMADMKGQLDENTGMTRALTHAVEVVSAKMEGFEVTTAKAESVAHVHKKIDLLDSKFGILNSRLFEQEAKMDVLRLVK